MTRLIPPGLEATLVLLRHGESTAIVEGRFQGRSNVPLSPMGVRQARRAAERLARPHDSPALPIPSGGPLEIVHSPLVRATETAGAVARALADPAAFDGPIPIRAEHGLAEIGQGEWEGRLATEIAERWGEVLAAWRDRPTEAHAPGGESLPDARSRVEPALAEILERLSAAGPGAGTSTKTSPVLGHPAGPTDHPWTILVGHDGVFKVALLTLFDLPLERFWLFPFALCGITIVEFAGAGPRLRAHNLTEHLAPLLEERAQEATEERERTGAL